VQPGGRNLPPFWQSCWQSEAAVDTPVEYTDLPAAINGSAMQPAINTRERSIIITIINFLMIQTSPVNKGRKTMGLPLLFYSGLSSFSLSFFVMGITRHFLILLLYIQFE
jgi:hypothetical protein